jgi:hypothetical protein
MPPTFHDHTPAATALSRPRRGAALLTTVLAVTVAASIVVVLTNLALSDLRTASASQGLEAAKRDARAAAAAFVADLNVNPTSYLDRVADSERARVCVADPSAPVIQPGAAWPRSCGTVWTYTNPASTADARIEVYPPGTSGAQMRVVAYAKEGTATAAREMLLERSSAAAWTVMSDADLALAEVNVVGEPTTSERGAYYSGGALDPATPNVTYTSSVFAAEGALPAAPGGEDNVRAVANDPDRPDVRDYAATPRDTSQLRASLSTTRAEACRGAAPANVTINDSPRTVELCLSRGQVVVDAAGQAVTVPDDTATYLVTTESSGGAPQVRVWTSSSTLAVGPTSGNLLTGASAAVAAGTHPGGLQFWDELGVFAAPVTGVVATDADTQIGICPTFHTGAPCAARPGSDSAGMTVSAPLTVIAGDESTPASIWFGSPVAAGADGQRLGAVAYGTVRFPYWARPTNADLTVAANIVALGDADSAAVSDVRVYPEGLVSSAAANRGGRLTVEGSIAGSRVGFLATTGTNPVFASTFVQPAPNRDSDGPHMASFDRRWTLSTDRPVAPSDVCPAACDQFLGGGSTGGSADTVAPDAPTGVTATPGVGSVSITWARPAAEDVAEFTVTYRPTAGGAPRSARMLAEDCAPSTCARVVSGLDNGTRYDFTVIAVDTSGNRSAASAKVTAAPNDVPSAPTGLTANAEGIYRVRLTWARPAGAVDGYRVLRNGQIVANVAGETWLDSSQTEGANPSYTVRAYNAAGDGPQSSSVSVSLMPGMPTELVAENGGAPTAAPTVALSWDTAPGTVTGYRIQRSTSPVRPGSSDVLTTVGPTVDTYSDTTAQPGRLTYYWVAAVNGSGTSITAHTQLMVRPSPPTGVTVDATGTDVTVTWDDAPGGQQIDAWEVWLDGALSQTAANTDGNAPTITLSSTGATGNIYIVARNSGGSSLSATVPFAKVPATPTGFAFTAASTSSLAFSWNAMPIATSYQIERPTPAYSETLTATSRTLTSQASATTQQWRVRACNAVGCSAWTAYRSMTTGGSFSVTAVSSNSSANSTGSAATWTVPEGVKNVRLRAAGGAGAAGARCSTAGTAGTGGAGRRVDGLFAVSPAQVLQYQVGKQGVGRFSGWPGGGDGTPSTLSVYCSNSFPGGGGGGGLSRWNVGVGGTYLLIAGGGGGGGSTSRGSNNGGNGGPSSAIGLNGVNGANGTVFSTLVPRGGTGGLATGATAAGGTAGCFSGWTCVAGGASSGGTGGAAAVWGGGGGGGFGGGGGGAAVGADAEFGSGFGGGGGGGSSAHQGGTSTEANTSNTGNGFVCVAWHGDNSCGNTPSFVP